MRKAAVVGTGAFVVPTIVTIDPADAQALTSPPPEPPGRSESPPVDLGNPPGTVSPPGTVTRTQRGARATGRSELPRTGADLDRLVAVGLAATAGGAALVLWSAESKAAGAKPRVPSPLTPRRTRDRGGPRLAASARSDASAPAVKRAAPNRPAGMRAASAKSAVPWSTRCCRAAPSCC